MSRHGLTQKTTGDIDDDEAEGGEEDEEASEFAQGGGRRRKGERPYSAIAGRGGDETRFAVAAEACPQGTRR